MLRLLPMLLILALALFAVIDCLSRDDDEIRGLPKVLWVLVILLFPLLGSLAWFIAGRPRGAALPGRAASAGSGGGERRFGRPTGGSTGGRVVAPDDDPEFLRRLDEQRRKRRADDEEPHTEQ
jgi:hypothetical protein